MGYFRVNYQKLITMAETENRFTMYHYQQLRHDHESGIGTFICPLVRVNMALGLDNHPIM